MQGYENAEFELFISISRHSTLSESSDIHPKVVDLFLAATLTPNPQPAQTESFFINFGSTIAYFSSIIVLDARLAIQLLDFFSKIAINDALYGRLATIPMLVILNRFISNVGKLCLMISIRLLF